MIGFLIFIVPSIDFLIVNVSIQVRSDRMKAYILLHGLILTAQAMMIAIPQQGRGGQRRCVRQRSWPPHAYDTAHRFYNFRFTSG